MSTTQPFAAQTGSLTTEQALEQAVTHHQEGRLPDAERLYRSILQRQPNHPDANHNLGVLAMQTNRPADGLSYLKAALEADPMHGQYRVSYVNALLHSGRHEAARQMLDQGRHLGLKEPALESLARRLEMQEGERLHDTAPRPAELSAAMALFNDGRYAELEPIARDLAVRYPQHGFGWKVLGVVFKQMGRTEHALDPMRQAVALLPGDPDVHYNLGVALQEMERSAEAEASFRRALELDPTLAAAHINLGVILGNQGRLQEAEASYRRALALKPGVAEWQYNLGNVLREQGRLAEAAACYRQAVEFKPDFASARNNLGHTLQEMGRLAEAEASCREALALAPDMVEAHANLGEILLLQCRLNEAEASYRKAIALRPQALEHSFHANLLLPIIPESASYHRRMADPISNRHPINDGWNVGSGRFG